MKTALTIVQMRWAITWATLKSSAWQLANYVITWLLALAVVVGIGQAAFGVNRAFSTSITPADATPLMRNIVVIVALVFSLLVILMQVLYTGQGSGLDPKHFELYGIPDAQLQGGMLLSGLSGTPAITCLLALLLWSVAYIPLGPAAFVMALLAAPLFVVTLMSISKLCVSLMSLVARSTTVMTLVTLVFCMGMGAGSGYLSSTTALMGGSAIVAKITAISAALTNFAGFAAWTPFAAAMQLPFDAMDGNAIAIVGRIVVLALTCVLCFMGSVWCLRFERTHTPKVREAKRVKGIGAFAWMPEGPSGAISARLVACLKHDPRQSMLLVMPLLFVAISVVPLLFKAPPLASATWMILPIASCFMMMCESNGLAYDGQGLTMQVLAGVSGRDDRHARVRVQVVYSTIYIAVLALILLAVSGEWKTGAGWLRFACFAAISLAIAWAMLGLAEISSCTMLYPVPSLERPLNTPQGRATAQFVFPLLYALLTFVVMIPTLAVTFVGLFAVDFGVFYVPAIAITAVINALIVLVAGTHIGAKLYDKRQLRILDTLEGYAALHQ